MTYQEIVEYVKNSIAKKSAAGVADMALQIDVVGEGEGAFYVEAKEGKFDVMPYEYYNYTAKLVITADELISSVDGKADKAAYQLEGDVEKISALVKAIFAKAPAKKAPAKKAPAKAEVKAEVKKEEAPKAEAKKAPAKKAPAKAEVKAEVKKEEAPKAEVKKEVKKAPCKKAPAKAEVKAEVKKEEAPKAEAKKAPAKKAPAKKASK